MDGGWLKMMESIFVLTPSILILLGATFLWFSPTYDDGVLGRMGLGLLVFSSLIVVSDELFGGVEYGMLPEVVLGRIGFALFLVFQVRRHLRIWTKERRACTNSDHWARIRGVAQ